MGKVLGPEAAPPLQHQDAVALLRKAEAADASAEAGSHDEVVEGVVVHRARASNAASNRAQALGGTAARFSSRRRAGTGARRAWRAAVGRLGLSRPATPSPGEEAGCDGTS